MADVKVPPGHLHSLNEPLGSTVVMDPADHDASKQIHPANPGLDQPAELEEILASTDDPDEIEAELEEILASTDDPDEIEAELEEEIDEGDIEPKPKAKKRKH